MKFLSNVFVNQFSFSQGCIGVLSMHLDGGENGGVNYLHNRVILV